MKHRSFGSTGWECSALGFGAMRFPTVKGSSAIDKQKATEMLRYAIEHGVNYVDTAYPYHDGQSEAFLGEALAGGYREEIRLATKLPVWMVKARSDCDRFLEEQLARLRTDVLDLYLLHALDERTWEAALRLEIPDWLTAKREQGVIRQIGFSFHDTLDVFVRILTETDVWSFCQIQYNYMDVAYQAGTEGLRFAHEKGLAVVVMEPLHGGQLAKRVPEQIGSLWAQTGRPWEPVEWALRWVWNHPEVSVVLSGMSTLEQVKQNIAIASVAEAGSLTEADLEWVDRIRAAYRRLSPVRCTACGYCQPCPSGVLIPRILDLYNNAIMYQEPVESRTDYRDGLEPAERADRCASCGACEEKCPQRLEIMEWLRTAHAFLSAAETSGEEGEP